MASTLHNQYCYYGCLIGFEPLSEAISLLGCLRNVKTKITFNKKPPTQDWLHLKLSIRLKKLTMHVPAPPSEMGPAHK